MSDLNYKTEIPKLLDMIEERIDSDENHRRQALWEKNGRPVTRPDKIPIAVSPEIQMWASVTGVNLVDYYQVPEAFICSMLKTKLFAFDNFLDDQPLDRAIYMWWGTPFEGSLFDIDYEFFPDIEPVHKGEKPYTSCRQAADQIQQPDFFKTGMMPIAHEVYKGSKQLLPDNYEITFCDYIQNPLSTAAHLLGMDHFLMEAVLDPDGTRALLKRLIEIRVQYRKDREKHIGEKFGPTIFDNDLVAIPIISPEIYRDLIWPIEMELAEIEGGIEYWHSCGNTAPMLEQIKKLGPMGLQHVSAWTDRARAADVIDKDQAIQVCVHPLEEVLRAPDEKIEQSLKEIVDTLGNHRLYINADCIQTFMEIGEQVKRIQHWVEIAQKITGEYA